MEKFYIEYGLFDAARLPYAIGALAAVALAGLITGPLGGNANPLYWQGIDLIFGKIGDKLDRKHREAKTLAVRGALALFFALIVTFFLARMAQRLTFIVPFGGFTEAMILTLTLSAGTLWIALARLYRALDKKESVPGAYYAISHSARVNLAATDDHGIARAALNYAARSFDKALVAPLFWYVIAGLPAAFVYSCVAAMSWRFGKHGFTKGFGRAARLLETILGFLPSVLSAILLTLASIFTPQAGIARAVASWGRALKTGSAPLNILAGTLNVNLGGPEQDVSGSAMQTPWLGPSKASAKIEPVHLKRALYLFAVSSLLLALILLGLYVADDAINFDHFLTFFNQNQYAPRNV